MRLAAAGQIPNAKRTPRKHWVFRDNRSLAIWIERTIAKRPKQRQTEIITDDADLFEDDSAQINAATDVISRGLLKFFFEGRKLSELSPRELLEHHRHCRAAWAAIKDPTIRRYDADKKQLSASTLASLAKKHFASIAASK